MLRAAVLALVAINLLYFGWSRWSTDDKPVLTAVASTPGHRKQPAAPPCATFGPFHDAVLADQADQVIAKLGWKTQRRATSETVSDGWWVYVSTTDGDAQAHALDTIRHSGMRDAFAMPNDAQFRVSAGLFSDEKRAQERATRVKRLKLDAVVQERHKQQPVIWLDLPGIARATLGDGRLNDSGLPLDQLRVEDCPAPTSGNTTAPATAPGPAHSDDADPASSGDAGERPATGVARVTGARESTAPRV